MYYQKKTSRTEAEEKGEFQYGKGFWVCNNWATGSDPDDYVVYDAAGSQVKWRLYEAICVLG